LKKNVKDFGDQFWARLDAIMKSTRDVWGMGPHSASLDIELVTMILRFLVESGYDLRSVKIGLLTWTLFHLRTEDVGNIMRSISPEIKRDVVDRISKRYLFSTNGTLEDLVSSAFLKKVTDQKPTKIGDLVSTNEGLPIPV
jgi:hypothetical protein